MCVCVSVCVGLSLEPPHHFWSIPTVVCLCVLVYPHCSVCVSTALKWFHTRNFGMLELEEGNLRGADWQYAGTGLMSHNSESTAG